jgi:hypothetical protein
VISREAGGEIVGAPVEGVVLSHTTEKWKNTWQLNLGGHLAGNAGVGLQGGLCL